jgi:hypothetical protein
MAALVPRAHDDTTSSHHRALNQKTGALSEWIRRASTRTIHSDPPIIVYSYAQPRSRTCITDGAAVLYRGLCQTPTVCLLSLAWNLYWNRLMFLII